MLNSLSFNLLLSVTSLLYSTSISNSFTYYVVPEDHKISSVNNTLHYYTRNSEMYFFSNVHLQFLPGKHYLTNTLHIFDISNFSMHGDDTSLTTIYCNSNAVITFTDSNNIKIKNLLINNCGYLYSELKHWTTSPSAVILLRCSDVVIQNCTFGCDHQQFGLAILDPIAYLVASYIKSGQLLLIHSNTTSDVNTKISYYEQFGSCINDSAIKIFISNSGHIYQANPEWPWYK